MLGELTNIKSIFKVHEVTIDNGVFRLHYVATFAILVTFSILVTFKQYLGDPIDCIVDEIPQSVMDTYCWIHSTYSIVDQVDGTVGHDVAHPGIAPQPGDGSGRKYHKYYQWVCFTLIFQAFLFYIPRYLWKVWEAGKLKLLVQGLNVPIISDETLECRKEAVLNYFKSTRRMQSMYAFKFAFCEILNLVNVIGQIFFMDLFLDGEFSSYGSDVISITEQNSDSRTDPLAAVFPKMTKCEFHKFGSSGTVQKFDGLCVLPLNIFNEKIYVFLWFWFIMLAIVSAIQVIIRVATIFSIDLRAQYLKYTGRLSGTKLMSMSRQYGQWFLLYQMSKNMDTLIFQEIASDID